MGDEHVADERLSEFVDGTLPADDMASVRRHFLACAACRAREVRLRSALASLAALPKEVATAGDLWPAVESAVRREGRRKSAQRWMVRAAAAAAFFIAGSVWPYAGVARTEGAVEVPSVRAEQPSSTEARLLSLQRDGGEFATRVARFANDPALDVETRHAGGEIALGAILAAAAELQWLLPQAPALTQLVSSVSTVRGNLRPAAPMVNVVRF